MSEDPFNVIHRLLKSGMQLEAIDRVYDSDKDLLRSPYDGDPNHAWYIVGDISFKLENYELAAEAFDRAVSFSEDDLAARMALANAYTELERPEDAEVVLREALEIDPDNCDLLYNLGNALFDQDKFQSALEAYSSIRSSDTELMAQVEKNCCLAKERMKST